MIRNAQAVVPRLAKTLTSLMLRSLDTEQHCNQFLDSIIHRRKMECCATQNDSSHAR
jgi:hypothetical protein